MSDRRDSTDHAAAGESLAAAFGRHVRALRRARGLTQGELGRRADLSADTIRRLEAGSFSPSLTTLRKTASGFGLTLAGLFELLDGAGEDRELRDLISTRTRGERALALRVLRALFDTLDGLDG